MLRVTWQANAESPRVLKRDEFIHELEAMAVQAFASAPPGPVVVEGLDEGARVTWHSYFESAADLSTLLSQLKAERELDARRAGGTLAAGEGSG